MTKPVVRGASHLGSQFISLEEAIKRYPKLPTYIGIYEGLREGGHAFYLRDALSRRVFLVPQKVYDAIGKPEIGSEVSFMLILQRAGYHKTKS